MQKLLQLKRFILKTEEYDYFIALSETYTGNVAKHAQNK
jgi:hypothetical protein